MAESRPLPADFLAAVREVVGGDHLLTDPDLRAPYETDWTRRFGAPAPAVIRPADTAQVSRVLALCSRHGVAVVPQGGNTGLVGGSVPRNGEVVLSLRRLGRVLSCAAEDGLLTAEGGATLAVAQGAAAAVGCELGIDIASRDSASLGGMVATNAGGMHVVRYGPMRTRVAGLEVVLADGTVASRLSGLVKDNVGYDLAQIMAGSEGTLGVVTKVVVHLVARPRFKVAALTGLRAAPGTDRCRKLREVTRSAVALSSRLRRLVDGIDAIEIVYPEGVALVREATGLAAPPDPGADAWLLAEASGAQDPTEALAGAFEGAEAVSEVAVADDTAGRAHLWAYRERHTEAIATLGVPHKLDVTLPPALLGDFASAVRDTISGALGGDGGESVFLFGHLGDGNMHVNVVGPDAEDFRADAAVFEMVIAAGGSISAEHGVGVAKLGFVSRARSAGDLEVMRRVKAALDPASLLNPGVLLPPALG